MLLKYSWMCGLLLEHGRVIKGYFILSKTVPSHSKDQQRGVMKNSHSLSGIRSVWGSHRFCTYCPNPTAVRSYVQPSCCVQKITFFVVTYNLRLIYYFQCLFCNKLQVMQISEKIFKVNIYTYKSKCKLPALRTSAKNYDSSIIQTQSDIVAGSQ